MAPIALDSSDKTASALKQKLGQDGVPVKLQLASTLKPKVPLDQLVFGRFFTDHMLVWEWSVEGGWEEPAIKPFANFSLHPASSVLHYGIECFEGMKAYKDAEGGVRLFRPEQNIERFFETSQRLALPAFDKDMLLALIKKWVQVESSWVPSKTGYSLYVRPTFISTQETLGVGPTSRAMLFVIGSPVGSYYGGLSSVSILAEEQFVRAWPGGTGCYKMGGNYAPGILPQVEAQKKGCAQILWLLGEEHRITEVGTMNLFVYYKTKEGKRRLFTPALDGTILPGVVRRSILDLCREMREFEVVEGTMTMGEISEALGEGRILEIFGSGTAAVITPVEKILYREAELHIPMNPGDPSKKSGPLAERLYQMLIDIQYGVTPHAWSVKLS